MKKLLLLLTSLLLISGFVFADDDDDFDDIFADAQDVEEAVVAETAATTPRALSPFHVYGNVNANLGIVGSIQEKEFNPGGYLGFETQLSLDIRPNDIFAIHTGIVLNILNYPVFSLSGLSFDYLFLNNIFISAGVKGVTWGYTRLFCNTDYYGSGKNGCGPQYTNIMADSGSYIMCQIRYPWSTGTLSFIPMIPVYAVRSGALGYGYFVYSFSYETTVRHTSMNLFGRTGGTKTNFNPLLGYEVKRTIIGFDVYGQGIVKVSDVTKMNSKQGYDYLTGTVGFYRLWEGFDPNVGFNLEYQCTRRHKTESMSGWSHLLAFEGGLKRMGPNKNHKIGVTWHHDILQSSGLLEIAYVISGIFPYANWSNACNLAYSNNTLPSVQFGTAISLDLDF